MRAILFRSLAAVLFLPWGLSPCPAQAADAETAADEETLKKTGVAVDGPALVEFFRQRNALCTDQERVAALVRRLGDGTFRVRNQAGADTTRLGRPALKALGRALADSDADIRSRADKCIKAIEKGPGVAAPAAAARLLKMRKPADACAALLAYLPHAEDEEIEEEVLE